MLPAAPSADMTNDMPPPAVVCHWIRRLLRRAELAQDPRRVQLAAQDPGIAQAVRYAADPAYITAYPAWPRASALAQAAGLGEAGTEILAFLIAAETSPPLQRCLAAFGPLTQEGMAAVLATALYRPMAVVAQGLATATALCRAARLAAPPATAGLSQASMPS